MFDFCKKIIVYNNIENHYHIHTDPDEGLQTFATLHHHKLYPTPINLISKPNTIPSHKKGLRLSSRFNTEDTCSIEALSQIAQLGRQKQMQKCNKSSYFESIQRIQSKDMKKFELQSSEVSRNSEYFPAWHFQRKYKSKGKKQLHLSRHQSEALTKNQSTLSEVIVKNLSSTKQLSLKSKQIISQSDKIDVRGTGTTHNQRIGCDELQNLARSISYSTVKLQQYKNYQNPELNEESSLVFSEESSKIISNQGKNNKWHNETFVSHNNFEDYSLQMQQSKIIERDCRNNFLYIAQEQLNLKQYSLKLGVQVTINCLVSIKEIKINHIKQIGNELAIYKTISQIQMVQDHLSNILKIYQVQMSSNSYFLIKQPYQHLLTDPHPSTHMYENFIPFIQCLSRHHIFPIRAFLHSDFVVCSSILKLHNLSIFQEMSGPLVAVKDLFRNFVH